MNVNHIYPSISVIMPCYKGESFIRNTIEKTEAEISKIIKDFELIVVIDGMVDNTYNIASEMKNTFSNLKILKYEKNMGKGYAIQHGIRYSIGEYVFLIDSDLDYAPASLYSMIIAMQNERADLVLGNRRDPKSTYIYPIVRKMSSLLFNIYVNCMFKSINIPDTQAGVKLIKRDMYNKIRNNIQKYEFSNGFIYDICLILAARNVNAKIVNTPCIFKMKSSTIGTGNNFIKTAIKMAKEVYKLKSYNLNGL